MIYPLPANTRPRSRRITFICRQRRSYLLSFKARLHGPFGAQHRGKLTHLLSLKSGEKMSLPGWSTDLHIRPSIRISSQQHLSRLIWSARLSSTNPESRRTDGGSGTAEAARRRRRQSPPPPPPPPPSTRSFLVQRGEKKELQKMVC